VQIKVPSKSVRAFFQEGLEKSTEKGSKTDKMLRDRESISITFCLLTTKIMNDGELSINLYFYNLMTDVHQRGSREIVQSRVYKKNFLIIPFLNQN
jgi:hypothetical protein